VAVTTDIESAIRFTYANARLLDRRRLEHLLGAAPPAAVIDALRAYQNPDGGFGHALEPDMRAPASEPASALLALETLVELGVTGHPMIDAAAEWIADAASADGTLPQMTAASAGYPHAPFIAPGGPTFLTYALAGALWHTETRSEWLDHATDWCWRQLEELEQPDAYTVVFALRFLDAAPDEDRALRIIDDLRPLLDDDGCLPVSGGVEGEHVTPLDLSAHPGLRSRALFTAAHIDADLALRERGQRDDGGWDFDFLHWAPGQALDWRGSLTVSNLRLLHEHGRISFDAEGQSR
jgi:hypothetical protein